MIHVEALQRSTAPRLLLSLVAALALGASPAPARAAEAPCAPAAGGTALTAAPPDDRTASLPGVFQPRARSIDQERLLTQTQRLVLQGLAEIDAPDCYAALVPTIAERTVFLSPFEFLIVSRYDNDWNTRDSILRLYRDDPRQAMREITSFWPSNQAELLIRSPGFFDPDANQVMLNLGELTEDRALNVMVHEFWHALTDIHVERQADGTLLRTSGFLTEQQPVGGQGWQPVNERIAGGIPTYLMNEAAAIEMEVAATGHDHLGMRSDLAAATATLHHLFDVSGREHVMQLYLESRSGELKDLAERATVVAGR